ncbi:MAG TPA: DedA family protein [Microscillaceae bacterium]|jgi:membrane-associated protein|nr:DedA family protein [Microscillaceae bacterium]
MIELLKDFIDILLHLDKHLAEITAQYGVLMYVILFLIIFAETGLVVTPFLPGDSLLFALGALAATGALNLWILLGLLFVAAVLGDTVNYAVGNYIGPKVFERNYRLLKKEYLFKTQAFYEKHGGKTIIIARFIPIIRTFAPFVAGVGTMQYRRFIAYNILGGFIWVFGFTILGYFFGNIPAVKRNFTLVIFGIIFLSVLPAVIEVLRHRNEAKKVA